MSSFKGYSMVLGSALCFGSYGVWSRLLGHDFGIFTQGWVRSALILVVLVPIALAKKSFKPITGRGTSWFWITMLFTIFTQVPLYYAFNHLPLGTATLIFYSLFLITSYVIGWLFVGEKVTRVKISSLFIALTGLLLTFGFSLAMFTLTALLLAALNGIASGGEVSSSKKSTHYFSSLQVTVYSWIFILITHLPFALVIHEKLPSFTLTTDWLAMIAYAATGLIGFWLVIEGFRYVDASIGGLIGLTEIIFSVLFGVLLFKDHLTFSTFVGGVLIISAAMLPDIATLLTGKGEEIPIVVN